MSNNKPVVTISPNASATLEREAQKLLLQYPEAQHPLVRRALTLAQLTGADHATPTGQSCLQKGLVMAKILAELQIDQETIAAALLYSCVRYADLSLEDVTEQLNSTIGKLIAGVKKMDALQNLSINPSRTTFRNSIDNVRKMLLAMVDDVRIVFIKLAERLAILRNIQFLSPPQQQQEAKITQDIYAPLANRLGIGHLKWELEDLSFRYLEPKIYNDIATALHSTQSERQQYVKTMRERLTQEVKTLGVKRTEVSGRAKHIYSIYRKMQRKNVGLEEIYDVIAFRVLVPDIEQCYAVLSHVHSLWKPIRKEFDDYITKPKPNGYKSIHTAVLDPEGRAVEIQIRTFKMHEEAEMGVAAHWIYKEGKPVQSSYEAKIAWLRQLMDWQKEVTHDQPAEPVYSNIFDDRIYVFTPQGDVIELVKDATPLDFAYHIHTDLGHRCRGAKINGHIVPLTHCLRTGECVEILTTKQGHPSRDWLLPSLGFLKTSRAKAKVLHWFREQDASEHLEQGQALLEKELRRLGLQDITAEQLTQKMHFPSVDDLFTSLGRGDTTLAAVIHAAQSLVTPAAPEVPAMTAAAKPHDHSADIEILGVGNLLTHMAVCCKPAPGDAVIGYVTQGSGISIHRQDCANVLHSATHHKERLVQVSWGQKPEQHYHVDIRVEAYDRPGLIRDITQVLTADNISIAGLNCVANKKNHTAQITLSIEINNLAPLSRVLAHIHQLPNVTDARRL
jgi:GTP pyrophosphokinase